MKAKYNREALTAVVAAAIMISAGSARAISYSITVGNTALSGYSGPYASVNVSLVSPTQATITFSGNVVAGNQYLFGSNGSADINVNAANWTLGSISGSNAGTGFSQSVPASQQQFSDGGSANTSDFGSFNQTIDSFGGFTHTSDTITFALTNDSGSWASDADVLTPNSDGFSVAAHIFVTSYPADNSNGALVTGYAADGSTTVPDGGSTVLLLGAALTGLGAMTRRCKK